MIAHRVFVTSCWFVLLIAAWHVPLSADDAASITNAIGAAAIAEQPQMPQPPVELYARFNRRQPSDIAMDGTRGRSAARRVRARGGLNPGETLASLSTGSTTPAMVLMVPNGAFYVRAHTLSGSLRSDASNEIRIFINQRVEPSAPSNVLATIDTSSVSLARASTSHGNAHSVARVGESHTGCDVESNELATCFPARGLSHARTERSLPPGPS